MIKEKRLDWVRRKVFFFMMFKMNLKIKRRGKTFEIRNINEIRQTLSATTLFTHGT